MNSRLLIAFAPLVVGACQPGSDSQGLAPEWTEPETGMAFVLIPGGKFEMGLRTPDDLRPAPLHQVEGISPFYLGRFEVTQREWRQVMGADPSQYADCDGCPVESVSWHDAQLFIEALSRLSPNESYRLPTESEWEYACRAESDGRYGSVDTLTPDLANFDPRIPFEGRTDSTWVGHPVEVGSYPASPLGLHDMSGNVWEWTEDEYCPYPTRAMGSVPVRCGTDTIAIRGGSWYFSANAARCGRRYTHARSDSGFSLGFRLVRELPQ